MLFNQIEADPEKDYALTENNGPYLIMACSFSGKGGKSRPKIWSSNFASVTSCPLLLMKNVSNLPKRQGRGFDSFGDPVRMKYHAGDKIEEVAVLVGEYPWWKIPKRKDLEENQIYQTEMPRSGGPRHHQPDVGRLAGIRT